VEDVTGPAVESRGWAKKSGVPREPIMSSVEIHSSHRSIISWEFELKRPSRLRMLAMRSS